MMLSRCALRSFKRHTGDFYTYTLNTMNYSGIFILVKAKDNFPNFPTDESESAFVLIRKL